MNIAVIAADGRLGREFVKSALLAGHFVRAGVRKRAAFEQTESIKVVHCDATNASDIKKLMTDQDVVVSCIGHIKGSDPHVQTQATKVIVDVMNELQLKRFVTVTGTGVRFPGDKIGLVDRILNTAVALIDPDRVNDGRNHMKILQASNLDWTVIRLLKLQNMPVRDFELLLHGPTKWLVGRKEVAKAILEVIEQDSFIKQSPIIARRFSK